MGMLRNMLGGLSSPVGGGLRQAANVDDNGRVTGEYWPTHGYGGGLYGATPATGLAVGEREAMACATVYACTRAIAETLGSLPALVYERVANDERYRARGSDAWSLLHDRPSPYVDSMQWYEMGTTRALNRGNFFAWMERDARDQIVALHPIHNSRVAPYWNGYCLEWHVLTNQRDDTNKQYGHRYFVLPDREVFNLTGFGELSCNGVISQGVLPRSTEEVSLDIAQQQYGSSFFGQGGRPSGIVQHPSFIDDDKNRQIFRDDLNQLHAGRENWNKIGVLWAGATWKEMSVAPEQAQFVASRAFQSKVICRFYNVPPSIVQIFDDFKFSTVEAMLRQFAMLTIRPWAVRWERAINSQVLSIVDPGTGRLIPANPDVDWFFEFLLEGLLRGSPKEQAEVNAIRRQWGVINSDEWRAQDNMNPLPNGQGQAYLAPLNYSTLDRIIDGKNGSVSGGRSTSSDSGSTASEGLPKFSKDRLIEMLEWVVQRRRGPQVRVGFGDDASNSPDTSGSHLVESQAMEAFGWSQIIETTTRLVRNEQNALRRILKQCKNKHDIDSKFFPRYEKVLAKQSALIKSENLLPLVQVIAANDVVSESAERLAATALDMAAEFYKTTRLAEETSAWQQDERHAEAVRVWTRRISECLTEDTVRETAEWIAAEIRTRLTEVCGHPENDNG